LRSQCIRTAPEPLYEPKRKRTIRDGGNVRYRHLQRVAEREQRRANAEQQEIRASEVALALWECLDTREQARWIALNALLEGNER
jgi:hypothetical protein